MEKFEILAKQWEEKLLTQEDSLLIMGGACVNPAHKSNNCHCNGNNCDCGCRLNNCDCSDDAKTSNNCHCGGDCGPTNQCPTNPCAEPPKPAT